MGEYKNKLKENDSIKISNQKKDFMGSSSIQDNRESTVVQNKVFQLARWKLTSKDQWMGIDPENLGQSKIHDSGDSPLGSVVEDTTGAVITPTSPGGYNLPTGSYGDWRKVARKDEQVDHFPPNAAYKGTIYESTDAARRPAFPIRNREGHRPPKGEKYGYGGHVSTTNSTFIQKGYTPDLNEMMKNKDYFGALKKELSDKSNVALYQYGNRAVFNELLKPGIDLALANGWISEIQQEYLYTMLQGYVDYPRG